MPSLCGITGKLLPARQQALSGVLANACRQTRELLLAKGVEKGVVQLSLRLHFIEITTDSAAWKILNT